METGPAARVAIQRLEDFLLTPEPPPPPPPPQQQQQQQPAGALAARGALVSMTAAAFMWQTTAGEDDSVGHAETDDAAAAETAGVAVAAAAAVPKLWSTIRGLTFEALPGEVLLVLGPVGAGKSSLLSAMLGEIPQVGGPSGQTVSVSAGGAIGYAAQQPWIKAGTLKDNVLFGLAEDPTRYAQVVAACALTDDIAALPAGDGTEIGEKVQIAPVPPCIRHVLPSPSSDMRGLR